MLENKRTICSILDSVVLLSLSAFAFYFNFKAGERGFFALDQSIFFDGGYRIVSGQIPYKDFYSSFGPMSFWLQAFFFKLLGVNYFAYIFGASCINLLATLSSVMILRLCFPSRRAISYLAGILTAIWFYPAFGTISSEHTALFFSLSAILLLLFALVKKNINFTTTNLLLTLSGGLVFASFISKQSIIVLFPLFFILVAVAEAPDIKRILQKWLVFSAGFLVCLGAFVLWLYLNSDIRAFVYHFFIITSTIAKTRFLFLWKNLCACNSVGPWSARYTLSSAFFIFICYFIMLASNFSKLKDEWKRASLACTIGICCVLFQNFFMALTGNNREMAFSIIGITFALGLGIALELAEKIHFKTPNQDNGFIPCNTKILKMMLIAVACIFSFFLLRRGINIALSRTVQDFMPKGTTYPEYMPIKKLKNLRWAHPTIISGIDVKEEDFVGLYKYLKERDKNFFIFPDFTIFYGLLEKPSPQPLLWFNKGHTYPFRYDPVLDKRIVEDLKRNNVEVFVFEEAAFPRESSLNLNAFPQLKSYFFENFTKKTQFGIFSIYEKR